MFFVIPFLLATVIIAIALFISLILKQYYNPTIAKMPICLAILIGSGLVYYGYRVVRDFDGAMMSILGIFTIMEALVILVFLKDIFHKNFFTNKR